MSDTLKPSPMTASNVCAIVVTYHPSDADLKNLYALAAEFPHAVIIDNGSAPQQLAALRAAVADIGYTLVENGENLGIATGFNRGMAWVIQNGFQAAFLFDQDSLIVPGFLDIMLAHYNAAPAPEKLGMVTPQHMDRRYGTCLPPFPGPGGNILPISSGCLLPVSVYQHAGPLIGGFFMCEADHEYALRLCAHGYRIEPADACMVHSVGERSHVRLFGKYLFSLTNHSPVSRYYTIRNRTVVILRYCRIYPVASLRLTRALLDDFIKVLLGEQPKWKKLRLMVLGLLHGLLGRSGPARFPH